MKPFSINIPILNEEKILVESITKLITYLDSFGTEYEIIIVSNGSTDQSDTLGKELEKKHSQIRFYSLPQKGIGRAFKKAIQEARYEHLISIDVDLTTELSFIEEANTLLDANVLVIGSKIMGAQKRSLARKIGSGIYIYIAKLLLGLSIHDFSIGAKGFAKTFLLKHLDQIDDYTSYVLKLAYLAKKEDKNIIEIPVKCSDFRTSKFNLISEAIYRFAMLFKLVFSSRIKSLTRGD